MSRPPGTDTASAPSLRQMSYARTTFGLRGTRQSLIAGRVRCDEGTSGGKEGAE